VDRRLQLIDEADDLFLSLWPNCSTPDCNGKICIGLSETQCYPCATGKPRDPDGNAVPPATAEEVASWREAAEKWWLKRLSDLHQRGQ
jgi:hypothetical protein